MNSLKDNPVFLIGMLCFLLMLILGMQPAADISHVNDTIQNNPKIKNWIGEQPLTEASKMQVLFIDLLDVATKQK